ncbi:MAG: hypothetical protein R3Y61_00810 [Rikenellaceae bacterium]
MDYQEDNNYDYDNSSSQAGSSAAKGLKIAIIILLLVLAAVSFLYWKSVQQDAADLRAMQADRDTIANQYGRLIVEMDDLQFENDTLNADLEAQRFRADSLMDRMKTERNISYSKIKKYEKELGTLRTTMQGFVRQIDSLNQLNKKLTGENLAFRREISDLRTTTEAAKETAEELNNKIQRGAVIKARDITLRAVNKRGKDVSRAKTAEQLVTTFILAANELSVPGERTVYVRIISPDGYDLAESQSSLFEFEGSPIPYTASRVVDYQGEDLAVSVYYKGEGLTAGQYTVHVYMDSYMVGSNVIILK